MSGGGGQQESVTWGDIIALLGDLACEELRPIGVNGECNHRHRVLYDALMNLFLEFLGDDRWRPVRHDSVAVLWTADGWVPYYDACVFLGQQSRRFRAIADATAGATARRRATILRCAAANLHEFDKELTDAPWRRSGGRK